MIYIVPQLPIANRYQSWIVDEIADAFKRRGIEFEVAHLNKEPVETLTNYFTNEYEAIDYELEQIKYLNRKLTAGDKVLWMDIDYPGFAVPSAFLFKARGTANIGIIHGAYFNEGDVWHQFPQRKWFDLSAIEVFDKVLVGTRYFKEQLLKHLCLSDRDKIVVTGLPFRLEYYREYLRKEKPAKKNIVTVVGSLPDSVVNIIRCMGFEVAFLKNYSYAEYLKLLSFAKAHIVWKSAETFGYSVLEALALNTPVIAPNKFSYPEFKSLLDGPGIITLDNVSDVVAVVGDIATKQFVFNANRLLEYMKASSDRIAEVVMSV